MSSDLTRWFSCAAVIAATAVGTARQPTFRSGVDLVTVDAAVLDGDGRPVPGLRAEDFRIEVDGRSRPIVAAHFVSQAASSEASRVASAEHFSSNEGADAGRVVVVAVDEGHIRRLEGRLALAAAARFIDTLPAADHVGVVGLTRADGVILTRDRPALRRRLEALSGNGDLMLQQLNLGLSEALEIADGNRSRFGDAVLRECGRALTEYVSTARAADDAVGRDACPEQVEQESRGIAQHAHLQARLSLTGLEALIDRLASIPGSKTIVLLSEGMIVDPRRVDLSRLTALAQAARVTIYGLQLEVPTFEAAQERVSPTLVRDLQVRHDGVALVTEAALRETPVEVLGEAVLGLPPASLLSYLSGAEPELRDQVLAACPRRLQGELKEELLLGRSTAPEEFLAARRELLLRLRDELDRRGPRAGNGGRA